MVGDFDSLAPNFRRAVDRWPEAPTLCNHYSAVVESYGGNGHGLIEAIKSFVECVCLTVLGEFGKPMPSANPSTTEMLVEALRVLGLSSTRGASKLDQVLSAHNRLSDALSEMRNENGPVAHGKDGFLDALTSNHLRAFLLTGDTLLALLLAALEGTDPDLQYTREPYERFVHLHERIDGSVTVESSVESEEDPPVLVVSVRTGSLSEGIELRIEPSRLLYAIDRAAYVELLASSSAEAVAAGVSKPSEKPMESYIVSSVTEEELPSAEIVPTYAGALVPLKAELQTYLGSLQMPEPTDRPEGADLVDSLLATAEANMAIDWGKREVLQARMKVAFKRTLTQFGIPDDAAKDCSGHLVTWFKIQSVGLSGRTEGAKDGEQLH